MKNIKQVSVELVEINGFCPEKSKMEFGKLYYTPQYNGLNHLCLCGCGEECYLPLNESNWKLIIESNQKPTIIPSILQRFDCKSHYIITNGKANFV